MNKNSWRIEKKFSLSRGKIAMFSLFLENSGLDLTKEVDKSELTDLDETYDTSGFR